MHLVFTYFITNLSLHQNNLKWEKYPWFSVLLLLLLRSTEHKQVFIIKLHACLFCLVLYLRETLLISYFIIDFRYIFILYFFRIKVGTFYWFRHSFMYRKQMIIIWSINFKLTFASFFEIIKIEIAAVTAEIAVWTFLPVDLDNHAANNFPTPFKSKRELLRENYFLSPADKIFSDSIQINR